MVTTADFDPAVLGSIPNTSTNSLFERILL